MNPFIVVPGSFEWKNMWYLLATKQINRGDNICFNKEDESEWKYRGSGKGYHEFIHTRHPQTGRVEVIRIPVSGR